VKELRGRNFVPTEVKSEGIDASCDTTNVSCGETDGTCEETFAISGETVVMPAEVKGDHRVAYPNPLISQLA
jgi:hypothetical protein